MCGIAGSIENTEANISSMIKQLEHRGPDGLGTSQLGKVQLGHTRLAIIDPEGGQQPLLSPKGQLVANGEIYNWQNLRQELDASLFQTKSDSEVALHLHNLHTQNTAEKLDGMFALAYTNGEDLILSRDPIGIKPLYYSEKKSPSKTQLKFASELKALQEDNVTIHTLTPGATWSHKAGKQSYYTIPAAIEKSISTKDAIKAVQDTLEHATIKRLMSDVPLGAFLSGGLDSSITAAIAKKHLGELHTFSVGIKGSPDLIAAKHVANHIGSNHHEYIMTPEEIRKDLSKIIYHLESFDEDLMVSAIPCYYVSKLAAQHVKVILTGEGADELFAGYKYYQDYTDTQELNEEMRRGIAMMHHVNLQRVDRMTMAHSLEGRVPFLDTSMIQLGLSLPLDLKLKKDAEGKTIEKWVLRKAFEDLLPHDIVWRTKSRFDEGTGTLALMNAVLGDWEDLNKLESVRLKHPNAALRTAQEAFYYEHFQSVFSHPDLILSNVGRWASNRVGQ